MWRVEGREGTQKMQRLVSVLYIVVSLLHIFSLTSHGALIVHSNRSNQVCYCDERCQKAHWNEHKADCKAWCNASK